MTLKELRQSKNLTQLQVANLLNISLRSYKQYENEKEKEGTFKYNYIYDELNKYGFIDEEHGILSIDDIKKIVNQVLSQHEVEYCYLFGSYARGEAEEKSDVDLIVATDITGMDFFGLCEYLREALHKKVDLLNLAQLNNNQQLLYEVLKDGIKIYQK
ncbi:MAG: nucleotidyltransferase domain-containing protein [Bacilli bacterium]|nr:nucleotidyltransferase domain-containing protein [Bacilli bacterium]